LVDYPWDSEYVIKNFLNTVEIDRNKKIEEASFWKEMFKK
jgi:hypothetical protein